MTPDQIETAWAKYCARCGQANIYCTHSISCGVVISREEAIRIRARYALGKQFNPDHDTTSYRDQ